MSQNDFNIANQSASSARADINNALQALASLSSGSSAPNTTYSNMLWYDTSNSVLKMRSESDDAWISIGRLNQSEDSFNILNNTEVTNSSGTQIGVLGRQSQSEWETGASTVESLVSPDKVKAAIDATPSWRFQSSTITVSTGLTSVAHGLAVRPTNVEVVLSCVAAQASYSVGDQVALPHFYQEGTNRFNSIVSSDSTNIKIRTGANGIRLLADNGQDIVSLNNSSWRFIVRAGF